MASAELVRATPPLTRDERPVGDADELQEMFPTLERAVIESALLQHCGAVEVTVDYLVALTQGDTTRLLQRLPSEDVGGPPRYVELPPQDTTEAGQKGRAARDRTFSAGKKTKTGSKYSRRLFGGHKAAVSSDGLDLELQLQEEGPVDDVDSVVHDHSDGSKPMSIAAKLARQLSLSSKRQGSADTPATSMKRQLLDTGSDEDELGPTQGYHKLDGSSPS